MTDADDRIEADVLRRLLGPMLRRVSSVPGQQAHGLVELAAWCRAADGSPQPGDHEGRLRAAASEALARETLTRVRETIAGPMIVLKGLEVSALYPERGLRPSADIDVLVQDPADAARRLLAAGCVRTDAAADLGDYQLPALAWTDRPHQIEVHRAPGWLPWMTPPTVDELFAAAAPGRGGVPDVLRLRDDHHDVFMAVHSWRTRPFDRMRDLVDLFVVGERARASGLDPRWCAEEWSAAPLLELYDRTTAWLLGRTGCPLAVRLFGRHLVGGRSSRVWEAHLASYAAPLTVTRLRPALDAAAGRAAVARRRQPELSLPRHVERVVRALPRRSSAGNRTRPAGDGTGADR